MKIFVVWDTDNCYVPELPEFVNVPDTCEEEQIADYLSDEFGFCVESFTIEV